MAAWEAAAGRGPAPRPGIVVNSVVVEEQTLRPKSPGESGYAMLLVFLVAAVIALSLYNELPRVAFEAQRAKEQLLIERGEEYKRAIQLFVRKVGRYPATIEELESLNNTRFLRKRYLDPMTGKEKWRLIHINGGVLTDSIVPKNKPGQGQQQPANSNTFIGEGPVMGATNDPNRQQINPAMQRRASDDRPVATQEAPDPPAPADEDQASTPIDSSGNSNLNLPAAPPGRPQQPGMYPGQPGYNPAPATQPGGTPGASPNQNSGQSGGQSSSGGVYVAPSLGQSFGQNGDPSSGSSVYVAPSLGQSASPGLPAGVTGLPGHGDALGNRDARNQRLAQQSAGGFGQSALGGGATGPTGQTADGGSGGGDPGVSGASNMQPAMQSSGGLPGMGGTQIGGGIAGVASESTGPAIAVYNERKKYNEWEFVYDQSKDRGLTGVARNGGAPGTPAQSMGSMPGQQPGMGGAAGSSGFGGAGGNSVSNGLFSGSAGFGQTTPQQTQPQAQQPPN